MDGQTPGIYDFGPFRLEPANHLLTVSGAARNLPPKAFETLVLLVENTGRLLRKEEMLETLWPGVFVEENNLTQQISLLRRLLGEGSSGAVHIETVPRLGYRFVAEVRRRPVGAGEATITAHREHRSVVIREVEEEEIETTGAGWSRSLRTALQNRRVAGVALRMVVTAAAAGTVVAVLLYRPAERRELAAPPAALKIVPLTTHGKAQSAAISPDGKYVAYVSGDPGKQGVWLRQVATHSDIPVVPTSAATIGGVTFSHDGGYIYYTQMQTESKPAVGYRVPVLGGEPRRVVQNLDSMVSLSPDDHRMVFARTPEPYAKPELVIASADDGEEQKLAVLHGGQYGLAFPAWSPDGQRIAAAMWSQEGGSKSLGIWTFEVSSGQAHPLGRQNWTSMDSLAWLPDGKHLVMSASESSSGPAGQIRELSYPSGELRNVTNDLTDYGDVSVTGDAKALVTIGTEVPSNVWVSPAAQPMNGRQITSGSVGFGGWSGLAWTPDQKLVYYTVAGGNQELWMMEADGSHPRRLTSSVGWKLQPSACPDNRAILFTVLNGAASNIWSVRPDGSSPRQLTHSGTDQNPLCSADSKWVVFSGSDGYLWKIPTAGGEPMEVSNIYIFYPALSPDGKWIASVVSQERDRRAIAVVPISGGQPTKMIPFDRGMLPVQSASKLQWSPDGEAVVFVDIRGGVSNLWSQPIAGGTPRPLTNFTSGQIFSFAWSLDGKQLAMTRGTISSDVILISNFER